ncbi:MAG: NAD-dependent DNA ligase LigA [Mycoplasmataceae bacterium]|nr:NAD-dependent DNA ligase LigA [Mycoplasmataceae bacterium]
MNDIKQVISGLNKKLIKWAKEYYEDDKPTVSDSVYDASYNQLVELENEYPELKLKDSVTNRVGGETDDRFTKVEHRNPMLSLSNAFNDEALLKFDKQIKDLLHTNKDIEYTIEYKIDGLSISLLYIDGKLDKAVTRGNGLVGEDVTHNVLEIKDVPKTIDSKETMEIRGEAFMPLDVFEELNAKGANFANPRNAAAGTLRQLDSNISKERKLSTFMYSIPNPSNYGFEKHDQTLKFISDNGLNINKDTQVASNIQEAIEMIKGITKKRKGFNYEIDGVVLKVNNISLWEDIGNTVKFPKYMIAYKFPEEVAQTELLDIFITIGRTGRVTYNAKLAPIKLAGTTVQAATLHNADYIRERGINIGDIVEVKKAGEIIPKVIRAKVKNNNEVWTEATNCSSCHGELSRAQGEVDQYCTNKECPQVNISKLEHFVSRVAMDIEGLSTSTIKTFLENGIISDIPSIFEVPNKAEEILSLDNFKIKSFTNISNAINKSKTNELYKLIFGLGIRHVGAKNAKILARRFGKLENIINASVGELMSIRDLGAKVSKSVVDYFSKESNILMLKRLSENGVNPKETDSPVSSIFANSSFVITGTLSKPRKHFADIIEAHNGNVSSAVTSKTTYLLAGEKSGSKLTKAKEYNIIIINEEKLQEMIEEEDNE